jgi:transcriptional regulator with XRE-family HTH domain
MGMANRIRLARRAAGMTLEKLAEHVGLSVSQISRLERGKRKLTRETATTIAAVLDSTWQELMDDPPPPSGFAEATPLLSTPTPPAIDQDEVRATIQEAVAAALTEHHLPNTQADIYRVAKAVERDLEALGELPRFPATLDLRVSEKVSQLHLKWQQAKASL